MAGALYDEMHADGDGGVRAHYRGFQSWLESQSADAIAAKRAEADLIFHRVGITFAVYGDDQGTERLIPFDIIRASSRRRNGSGWRRACASA